MKKFHYGQKVKTTISMYRKLKLFIKCYLYDKTFNWMPNTLTVLYWRDDMDAYEAFDEKTGKRWFIISELLEKKD